MARRGRRFLFRLHDGEIEELRAIAEMLQYRSVAALLRAAVDNLVADFRADTEPLVFDRLRTHEPIAEERRSSVGRRAYDRRVYVHRTEAAAD